jgi:hypothetical protein
LPEDVIEVGERDGIFVVVVDESSEHHVSVPDGYLDRLGLAGVDGAAIVRASFEFLLEREPKESILRSFELSVIERYFPEYPAEIFRRLR